MADNVIRKTISICPVCHGRIPAFLERDDAGVWLQKECAVHGAFRTIVWRDLVDLEEWISREEPLDTEAILCCGECEDTVARSESQDAEIRGVPEAAEACCSPAGESCCVLLEVTGSCNLSCAYCFANGGESDCQPSFEELQSCIDIIADKGGGPLLQLTGGEPTLRDDLPELAAYAKKAGCSYTQVNTNGIRLAEDADYVKRLAEAGVDIVFLQFDGTDDEIYRGLRGRDLLETKLRAIENCGRHGIGVTLVPTVVRGVNEHELGNIVRTAARLFSVVTSVHFQPVTYLGRYPGITDRYTLDELMRDLSEQTGIPLDSWLPSRCDHAMCEFHSTFILNDMRQLVPMTSRSQDARNARTTAAANRDYVAGHWSRARTGSRDDQKCSDNTDVAADSADDSLGRINESPPERPENVPLIAAPEAMDIDELIYRMRCHSFKISAMAFQDGMNLDLERLSRCSLHVYDDGELLPFCAKYLGLGMEGVI